MNAHPVAEALVTNELTEEDANWLLGVVDEVGAEKAIREITLNKHDLLLNGVEEEIVIEDILDCSAAGRCKMTFDEFKSLLLEKMSQIPGATFPA